MFRPLNKYKQKSNQSVLQVNSRHVAINARP